MKRKSLVYIYFSSIAILAIMDLFSKDDVFSEMENRYLKRKPKVTNEAIFNGEYTKNYEEYLNDHFIFRDQFINIKSLAESAFLKKENNGIIYGKNAHMFDKQITVNNDILKNNIETIKKFTNNVTAQLMIVPYSSSILNEYLPYKTELIPENSIIDKINKYLGEDRSINIYNTLLEHKKDYIYYRTDHHWTSYGAYLAYQKFCEKNKIKPIDIEILKENKVNNFLGTYYSKSKKINVKADILTYYDMDNLRMEIDNKSYDNIYNLEVLDTRDKYPTFINGNNGLTKIINSNQEAKGSILIIKDSFANSMIPFIANNYKETIVIDLRQFKYIMSEYLQDKNFDNILLLYSFNSLNTDTNISRLNF